MKHLISLLCLLTIACNHHKTLVDTENFVVDYDRDSIFYLLDVKEDDHNSKEKLLVTRQMILFLDIMDYNKIGIERGISTMQMERKVGFARVIFILFLSKKTMFIKKLYK